MSSGRVAWVPTDLGTLFRVGNAGGLGDAELLRRFVDRHDRAAAESAFAALVERHGPMVTRVCRDVLGDDHDAQDAAQATFLVLARRAGALLKGESVGPWLFGVARRISAGLRVDIARRKRYERQAAEMAARQGLEGDAGPPPEGPWAELYEEIDRLPERYRTAVVLCDLEGLTHQEVADQMQCPIRTIQSRLYRARERLRPRLSRRGLAPFPGAFGAMMATPSSLTGPLSWADPVSRDAVRVAAGEAMAAVAAAEVSRLAEGVLKTMELTRKLRMTAVAAGTCGLAVALAVGIRTSLATPVAAEDPPRPAVEAEPTRPAASPVAEGKIAGRVVDEAGKPIAGARVRLYRRANRWERRNRVAEETTTGPEGSFRLVSKPEPSAPQQSRGLPGLVLVADHPGQAVGWRVIPENAETFTGDVVLTKAADPRTVTVTDADGRPVAGALVAAYGIGDASSPSRLFREHLELRPVEPPLAIVTDAEGRAKFESLPATKVSFYATKPGFAESLAFREQEPIRLTPSASVSGRVTGPDGRPLAGVKVVLYTKFMWDFYHAVTDAEGRYRFDDLKAKGWDMSQWTPGKTADGAYNAWIESDRFAVPTQSLVLEPGARETLDLTAQRAGVIRVTLLEEGTNRPVANARIWGFDAETGSSARFNAYTDREGRATFHATPARISLSLAGPPEGVHFKEDLHRYAAASRQFDFDGRELDFTLLMPPVAGRLISVSGTCVMPDGSPAVGAVVWASSGKSRTTGGSAYGRPHRVDGTGRFDLEGVASSVALNLFAQVDDGRLAGTATVRAPDKTDPAFRVVITLRPTAAAIHPVDDSKGLPLALRDVQVTPRVGEDDMIWLRQSVRSDATGMVRVEHALPGLAYRFQAYQAANPEAEARGGPFFQLHDDVTVLIPLEPKPAGSR